MNLVRVWRSRRQQFVWERHFWNERKQFLSKKKETRNAFRPEAHRDEENTSIITFSFPSCEVPFSTTFYFPESFVSFHILKYESKSVSVINKYKWRLVDGPLN